MKPIYIAFSRADSLRISPLFQTFVIINSSRLSRYDNIIGATVLYLVLVKYQVSDSVDNSGPAPEPWDNYSTNTAVVQLLIV